MTLLLQLWVFFWGAVWGSFLNVVIYRVPLGLSLVRPGSRCSACGTPIRWYDNIPVLSYLILRGRCRACGAGYGPQYMIIEAACGVLALALFNATVLPLDPDTFLPAGVTWLWLQTFVYGLVAITFIDLRHFYIPDEISLPLIAIGIGGAFLIPAADPLAHAFGAAGAALFMLALSAISWLAFRREALGLGDAKLLAAIGAFVGWKALPFVLFASAIQALIATGVARLYTRVTGRSNALTLTTEELDAHFGEADRFADAGSHTVVPYGPFLALAGLEVLLFGDDLLWRLVDTLTRLLLGLPATTP